MALASGDFHTVPTAYAAPRGVRAALEAERANWFCWTPVFFGAGIAAYFSLPWEPPLNVALGLVVLALAAKAATWRGSFAASLAASILLAGACGFAAIKLRVEQTRAPVVEKNLYRAEVKGFVEIVEPRPRRGQRLTILVSSLGNLAPEKRPAYVRIRTLATLDGLKAGDAVRIKATLAPPAKPAIPGGFDFARTAWFQQLGGIGYAVGKPEIDTNAGEPPAHLKVAAAAERFRQTIGARIAAVLPGENGAIAAALITGERGSISNETNDAYRDSGLFHILSISGLHMTTMAGAAFLLVRLLLAASPAIALQYPIKKWAAVAGSLATLAYLLISGSSYATLRSAIMIAIMFFAVLLDRRALALRNIALAALLILAFYPESLLDVGFQMSFAAVTALVATYEYLRTHPRSGAPRFGLVGQGMRLFGGIVLSTLIAGLAVAPFAAYHFYKSQQFAVLANLIGIPLCNIVVMPAALLTLLLMPFGLERLPLLLMGLGIDGITWCARWVASLPGAVGNIAAMPDTAFLLFIAGGLWLTLMQTRWRLWGLGLVAAGVALAPTLPKPDLLVAPEGPLVAVRGPDGRLSALPAKRSKFELEKWLQHDGDARTAAEAGKAGGFRCDAIGCTASVKGVDVSVARHPAALPDDCHRARLLVLDIPQPSNCTGPARVFDFFTLRDGGTHAVYIAGPESFRIETVSDLRGERPWSPASRHPQRRPRVVTPKHVPETGNPKPNPGKTTPPSPPTSAAAPADTKALPPRPEIEDEDEEFLDRQSAEAGPDDSDAQ
jgi:competence protein ComEC